ncbi:MAG: DUF4430 domain-containing protein [Bacillota bacterium]|nr:DUF4430 domain-containing protein [Bacillota bacterium]
MWFQKNKRKILIAVLGVAVLGAAFYFGGGAPDSRGWTLGEPRASAAEGAELSENGEAAEDTAETGGGSGDESAEPGSTAEAPTDSGAAAEAEASPEPSSATAADPEADRDQYQTDSVPEGMPLPAEPQEAVVSDTALSCTISISCATILEHMDLLDPEKAELVPEDGWILEPVTVTFYEGESVFNVLQRSCKEQGVHMEFASTPVYNSAYIEGIHNLYEFDCGSLSGWMYKVNEWFPNYGSSRYQLCDGDVICWVYTCDLGYDVSGRYFTEGWQKDD